MTVRLRGRELELEMLRAHLDALVGGRGGVVVIRGAPGLGKSALLEAAESMARRHGARVFHGGSDQAQQAVPLGPLLDALLHTDDPPVDADALRALSGSADQRFWLLREFENGLESAAIAAPLVIALDDIQWADPATLVAIAALPKRLSSHRILWLFAIRAAELSGPARDAVGRLRSVNADILTLNRLGTEATRAVSEDLLGAPPDTVLQGVIDGAGGQPFLLVELLRGLRDESLVEVHDGTARLNSDTVPHRLQESVVDQLDRLPRETREALRMASVLGRRFSADELASLMDTSPTSLVEAIRVAIDAGLVVEDSDRLAFRHDLVRESIVASIPTSVKRTLQRRAMEVMLSHGSDPAEVATLAIAVAEPGDRRDIELLRRAASEIGRFSPSVAAPLSLRALELMRVDDPDYSTCFLESENLLVAAGQAAEATKLLCDVSTGPLDPMAEGRARLGLVPLLMQYSATEAVSQCQKALAIPQIPCDPRVQALTFMSMSLEVLGARDEAAEAAQLAVAESRESDGVVRSSTLLPQGLVAFAAGDWANALSLADQAVEAVALRPAEQNPSPAVRGAWKLLMLLSLGRVEEARPIATAGLNRALNEGVLANVRIWSMVRCRLFLAAGEFDEATAEADAVLELSDEINSTGQDGYINNVARYVHRGCVATHTGDLAELSAARHWASRTFDSNYCLASRTLFVVDARADRSDRRTTHHERTP